MEAEFISVELPSVFTGQPLSKVIFRRHGFSAFEKRTQRCVCRGKMEIRKFKRKELGEKFIERLNKETIVDK